MNGKISHKLGSKYKNLTTRQRSEIDYDLEVRGYMTSIRAHDRNYTKLQIIIQQIFPDFIALLKTFNYQYIDASYTARINAIKKNAPIIP